MKIWGLKGAPPGSQFQPIMTGSKITQFIWQLLQFSTYSFHLCNGSLTRWLWQWWQCHRQLKSGLVDPLWHRKENLSVGTHNNWVYQSRTNIDFDFLQSLRTFWQYLQTVGSLKGKPEYKAANPKYHGVSQSPVIYCNWNHKKWVSKLSRQIKLLYIFLTFIYIYIFCVCAQNCLKACVYLCSSQWEHLTEPCAGGLLHPGDCFLFFVFLIMVMQVYMTRFRSFLHHIDVFYCWPYWFAR